MYYFFNAHIHTQDPSHPTATSMLVDGATIVELDGPAPPGVEAIDLQQQVVLPGFIDAHIHIWKVGDLLTSMLDLRGVKSRAEVKERLAAFAQKHPEHPWILARGFNEALFPDGQMPDRHDLDEVLPDRPCQLTRTCAHIAVLNSKALEICGITAQTPVPPGGEIRKDADGQPNGILSETALGFPKHHIPPPTHEAYRHMILAAQEALLEAGITSAADPAVTPDLMTVYREMEAKGELKIRVHAFPVRVPDGATEALPLPERYYSEFLVVDTVKFFSDGGISGKTAALEQPYKNTNEHGVLRLEYDFFRVLAQESQDAGFRIATHAIGDAAIERVLQVYESLQNSNHSGLRHRIEHLGLPTEAHLKRMRDLGIICVSQPIFVHELGLNFRNYLPEAYLNRIYPYRSILDSGVSLAFSSDAPVVKDFRPLTGIRNAVERRDIAGVEIGKHESIHTAEAIEAYTKGAALANGTFDTGVLAVGKKADFIVLSAKTLEFSEQTSVLETWVNGTSRCHNILKASGPSD